MTGAGTKPELAGTDTLQQTSAHTGARRQSLRAAVTSSHRHPSLRHMNKDGAIRAGSRGHRDGARPVAGLHAPRAPLPPPKMST